MESRILYIFTRTPLHVGAGSSVGAIDQPIQRERHTGFPIIPGSSLKGCLRDVFNRKDSTKDHVDDLFGRGNDAESFTAGKISFSEAHLLAFPVRSAKGSYALATCPLALSRFARDAKLNLSIPTEPKDMECLAGAKIKVDSMNAVVLEEYKFTSKGDFPSEWQTILSKVLNDAVLGGSIGRWILLSNGDFSHFALTACQVNQHVSIDDETGTAKDGALFNEETVPSETLFYSTLTALLRGTVSNPVFEDLKNEQLIQIGGNSTSGLGFCTIKLA